MGVLLIIYETKIDISWCTNCVCRLILNIDLNIMISTYFSSFKEQLRSRLRLTGGHSFTLIGFSVSSVILLDLTIKANLLGFMLSIRGRLHTCYPLPPYICWQHDNI